MGEIADMVLDGTLCRDCGGIVCDDPKATDEEVTPGYPRTCSDCKEGEEWD